MRHQPGLLGQQPEELTVDGRGIDGGEPEPAELRHLRQQAADHLPEPGRPRQVRAP